MASIRLIKRRIKSAQNIAQITRAMQMVAASKMKKAIAAAQLGRLYAEKIYSATRDLAGRTETMVNPLLGAGNPHGKTLVILISTNKSLCGGLNTNLFRQLLLWFPQRENIDFITLGSKGENFTVRNGQKLVADFSVKLPFVENVPAVTQLLVDGFLTGQYREVYVVYSSFVNALKQNPAKKQILPLTDFTQKENAKNQVEGKFSEFIIEPSIDDVLANLLPHYLENMLRAAILEAEASEHSARMIAMKNATDAATDFMHGLTMILNKARQEKITYEIADMVTARMAVAEV